MTFFDDDLKRLKEMMERYTMDLPQVTQLFRDYHELLPAFLIRLEAAEEYEWKDYGNDKCLEIAPAIRALKEKK